MPKQACSGLNWSSIAWTPEREIQNVVKSELVVERTNSSNPNSQNWDSAGGWSGKVRLAINALYVKMRGKHTL